MNILLINNNPVVSRLLVLCTRDGSMVLEEVESVERIQRDNYDVVFVDEGSYEGDVLRLSNILSIGKKVLLSNTDIDISDFDMTIKKPFLPSQIIEVLSHLNDLKKDDHVKEESIVVPSVFPLSTEEEIEEAERKSVKGSKQDTENEVLDSNEIEKIKSLLEMDEQISDELFNEETLNDEEYETRKIEVIKEQLIAEGLEIVDEEEIVDVLSEKSDNAVVVTIFDNQDVREEGTMKKKNKDDIGFTAEELEKIEDAVEVAIAGLKKKKMKKLLKGKEIQVRIKLEGND